jgi:hypothetical protein
LKKTATRQGLYYQTGFVQYISLKYFNGSKNVFQKDLKYSHECEWRAFFTPGNADALTLKLGSLKSISKLCQADLSSMNIYLQNEEYLGMENCKVLSKGFKPSTFC